MIIPMRKATLLFPGQDAESTVSHLRSLGVMQVEHQNQPEGKEIASLSEKVTLIETLLGILNQISPVEMGTLPQQQIGNDWETEAAHIVDLEKRLEQLETSMRSITGQIGEWEPWGDISQAEIQALEEKGLFLRLFQVPKKEIENFPDDVVVKVLFTSGDHHHVAVISRRPFVSDFREIFPPREGLYSLQSRLAANTRDIGQIKGEILLSSRYYESYREIQQKIRKEIEFQKVLGGMGRDGSLGYVTGYIPADREEFLVAEAKKKKWGVLITDPSEEDNVPTLLCNPPWVRLITPVLALLGLTPGYRELDVSVVFLVFFSIFFGILIGDAGYGLIYVILALLAAFWMKKKGRFTEELETSVHLFILLGGCAVIWGLLTGTFFGQGLLTPLVPILTDAAFVTTLCFFLGALHLSIAHSWRALLKLPSLKALADIGYICILWTAFFLARTLILGEPFPESGFILVAAGVTMVVFFTNPRRSSILRGIGEGLGTIALSFMNNITDVISYIRLFAVSMAGLAVAETTNYLASGFGTGLPALLAGGVILLSGHSLNLILGLMSVLVHGVRLNVLEFSGHANVTWSGSEFEPLKE